MTSSVESNTNTSNTNTTSRTGSTEYPFQAEVSEVLRLVIHSLYSHREIFLRELISNASDALDKIRFRSLTEPEVLGNESDLEIRLRADEKNKTLSIEDTGIGMTKEELIRDLGTVAHSGSRAFLELAAANPEGKKNLNLIGQFGVGFYSAYLVADRVEVISKAAGASESFVWRSDGTTSFTVEPATRGTRGTEVIVHFRDEHKELLGPWELRELVKRYSDFVSWPIKLEVIAQPTKTEPDPKPAWERLNQANALWQRPKNQITEEQYDEFYRHLSHGADRPLARVHFRAEGTHEFVGLLYIPERAPFDLNDPKRRRGVRLFVRRVFIMDECEELVPTWLRFVRGVIDSDDLPLNVSRELLQDSKALAAIKKQIIKKTLDLLEETAREHPDKYETFWKGFGNVMKEALALDAGEHRERVGGLLRFQTSHYPDGKLTSLADYIARIPTTPGPEKEPTGESSTEGSTSAVEPPTTVRNEIYYLVGESRPALEGSPHIEALRSNGVEVLYMTEPVDDWAMRHLGDFQGKRIVNAMQADLKPRPDSQESKEDKEREVGAMKPLIERIEKVLKDKVREVQVSSRLTDSPCCLAMAVGANSPFLERLLKERRMGMPAPKRVFEINPSHPLLKSLRTLLERDPASPRIDEWIQVMYDQALLAEGSVIEDAPALARRIASLLVQATERDLS
jgi:molecular chaperone HtpG